MMNSYSRNELRLPVRDVGVVIVVRLEQTRMSVKYLLTNEVTKDSAYRHVCGEVF